MNNTLLVLGTVSLLNGAGCIYNTPVSINHHDSTPMEVSKEPVYYVSIQDQLNLQINSLLLLEQNWNGYGAIPLLPQTIKNSKALLYSLEDKHLKLMDEEDIVPSPYGTINFYFEDTDSNELNIEIGESLIGMNGIINGSEIFIDDINASELSLVLSKVNELIPYA